VLLREGEKESSGECLGGTDSCVERCILRKRNVFSLDLHTVTQSLLTTVFGNECETAEAEIRALQKSSFWKVDT